MNADTSDPVRHFSPLLAATRFLAALHGLAGLLLLCFAAYVLHTYHGASDDDYGLGLFFGSAAAVLGVPLVVLSPCVLLARRPVVAYVSALALALVVVVAGVVLNGFFVAWLAAPGRGDLVVLPSVVLLVCAIAGLARGEASRTADST